jgi:hypothetical protein
MTTTQLAAARTLALSPLLRQHRCEAARWALATGRPLTIDAITAILAAKEFDATVSGERFDHWTRSSVLTFLFGSAVEFCRQNNVDLPSSVGESLVTYLQYLEASHGFAPKSSPVAALIQTVTELSGLTPSGRVQPSAEVAPLVRMTGLRRKGRAM